MLKKMEKGKEWKVHIIYKSVDERDTVNKNYK